MDPRFRLAWSSGSKYGIDYKLFGIGFGPALGMNFNLPGQVTLGIKTGYQIMSHAGDATDQFTGLSNDITLDENMFYVNFVFMFRSGEDKF